VSEAESNPLGGEWRVRRAVVDDLAALSQLWREAQMPGEKISQLEKSFTDFQVVEDADGRLHGALALEIAGRSGRVHSEAISNFALADTLRPLLWVRVNGVAHNHGLHRLWTQETAPFWKKDIGFAPPPDDVKPKFPEAFGLLDNSWAMLRLREEGADPDMIEQHFAAFRDAERARRERMLSNIAPLKWIGLAIAAALLLIGLASLFHVLLATRRR